MKKKNLSLQPRKLARPSVPAGERDTLEAIHLFESTGLIGLRTAAVAAMATVGQPLTGLFQPTRDLVTEHLQHWLQGETTIPASTVRELAGRLDLSVARLMTELVPVARQHARAPISNYRVGAVVQGDSGALYLGFNIEFSDNPLFHTVGAEQAALINAMNAGEKGIRSIACTNAPSGYCRQFLYELEVGGELKVHLTDRTIKLKSLLPSSFGPREMGQKGALLSSPKHELKLSRATRDAVVQHALEAACCSYAPYSHCPSGVALATRDQSFSGSYCENAAFNPSLSPFHAAVVSLNSHGFELSQVQRVVLVERPKQFVNQVHQMRSTQLLTEVLCPQAVFELHAAVHRAT